MKKFKFKLDALLKLREFNEKKIKVEWGEILKEINTTEELIAKMNRDIDEVYAMQEEMM
jgi:flagellar FliJ protein